MYSTAAVVFNMCLLSWCHFSSIDAAFQWFDASG